MFPGRAPNSNSIDARGEAPKPLLCVNIPTNPLQFWRILVRTAFMCTMADPIYYLTTSIVTEFCTEVWDLLVFSVAHTRWYTLSHWVVFWYTLTYWGRLWLSTNFIRCACWSFFSTVYKYLYNLMSCMTDAARRGFIFFKFHHGEIYLPFVSVVRNKGNCQLEEMFIWKLEFNIVYILFTFPVPCSVKTNAIMRLTAHADKICRIS